MSGYCDQCGETICNCNDLQKSTSRWVGLTDDEYEELSKITFVEVIEKIEELLRRKNT